MKRRIWAGCLAAYNAGTLHGEWLALDDYADGEALHAAIETMLAASPSPGAEEWHLADAEGFGGLDLDRYASGLDIWALHEAFELGEASGLPTHVVAWVLALDGEPLEQARDSRDLLTGRFEAYRGEWPEPGAYARDELVDQAQQDAAGDLWRYIDWQAVERDLIASGDLTVAELGGARHLFSTLP